ncbi:phosphoglycerate kinase [Buchnera aphidicola]|uniref:phosphoglycerate kinase n=1 Tax=Buchnera aphidicola TaxID=9 RepID=UPI0031B8715D
MNIKNIIHMNELNLYHKTVLIRVDFNVTIQDGKILSDKRIQASIPTIQMALKQNAKIIIMSHLGRPTEGKFEEKFSLLPIVKYLKKIFKNHKVFLSKELKKIKLYPKEICILENVRFNYGEKENNDELSKKYASLCDIFIMDAFGSAHRKEASTFGVGFFSKIACAGPLLINELNILKKHLHHPQRPMTAIIGGAKISTKFKLLKKISSIADHVIVGGGIANTFLAIDYNIGKSLHEPKFIQLAKKIRETRNNILVPIDSRVGKNFSKSEKSVMKTPDKIFSNEEIMDIGDKSIKNIKKIIQKSKTIIWNGPLGVFEFPNFCIGTKELAYSIAKSNAFSIAGGGETLSVIEILNIKKEISYISTGGGAFLQFIENENLPIIDMLKKVKNKLYKDDLK